MGILDSMKNWIGVGSEDVSEGEEVETVEQEKPAAEPAAATSVPFSVPGIRPVRDVYVDEKKGNDRRMPMSNSQVVLLCPTSFEEATAIADHLCEQHTVVLNLEGTGREVTRRLVDFLSGAAYANKGMLRRIAKQTFLITPQGVEALGELNDSNELSSGSNDNLDF